MICIFVLQKGSFCINFEFRMLYSFHNLIITVNFQTLVAGCASNEKSIKYLLSTPPRSSYTGRATVLIVGGASESMESTPGTYRVIVKRRKGFVKLALKYG